MMRIEKRPTGKRVGLPGYMTAALALLALLVLPAAARAQWAQDAGNNIHNTNSGNVGVGTGTTAPVARLEVRQVGNSGLYPTILLSFGANEDTFIRGGSSAAVVHIGDLTATTSKLLLMENGGVVGIGTTTPGLLNGLDFSGYIPLHIKGSGSKTLMIDTNTPSSGFAINDSSQPADNRIWQISQGAGNGKLSFSTYTDAGTSTHRLVIDRSGNVGVGNVSPAERLHVSGGNVWGDSANAMLMLGPSREVSLQRDPRSGAGTSGWLESNAYLDGAGNWQLRNTGTGGVLAGFRPTTFDVWTSPAGASPAWVQQFFVSNTTGYFAGSVGIGNTSPAYKLDVNGSVNGTGLCIAGDCKTAWSQVGGGSSQWTTSGSDIYFNTGNVGIGTAPSSSRLHLYSSGNTYMRIGATLANQSAIAFNDDTNGQDIVLYRPGGTRDFSMWTATSSDVFRLTQAGNVGVGTASPGARLHVVGANGPLDNTATPAPTAFSVTGGTGGNGTWGASPGGAGGGITLTGGTGGLPVAGSNAATGGTGGAVTINGGTGGTSAFTSSGAGGSVVINGGAAGGSSPAGPAGNVVLANLRGNVGVGTATPAYKLDVQGGQVNASGGLCIAGDCKTTWAQVGGGTASNVGAVNVSSGQFGANVGGGNFSFPASVGIGTTSPAVKLAVGGSGSNVYNTDLWVENNVHVQGNETLTQGGGRGRMRVGTAWGYMGLYAETSTAGAQNDLVLGAGTGYVRVGPNASAGGSPMNLIVPNGSVGVGTATPAERLHVSGGNVWGDSANAMLLLGPSREVSLQRDPRSGAGTTGWLESNAYLDGAGNWQLRNTGAGGVLAGIRPTTFDVWTAPAGASPAWVQQFFVNNSTGYFAGSVGIGNTNPAYKLDVNGSAHVASDMTVDGNISAKYQDVAEWVPSSQKLTAGTVVVLDTTQTNHVLASTKAYDTAVAGVVSDSPGVILGQRGEDKLKVATTGRVKVKVDAARAPIKVGDLLVTSEVEGVAMKSVPFDLGGTQIHRPGTIIGKALEPLEKGTGEILVLLSLQ